MSRFLLLIAAFCGSAFSSTLYLVSGSISNGGPSCGMLPGQCQIDSDNSYVDGGSTLFAAIITPQGAQPYNLSGYGPVTGVSVELEVGSQNGVPQATGFAQATWSSNLIVTGVSGTGELQASFYVNAIPGEDCVTAPLGCSAGITDPQLSIGPSTTASTTLRAEQSDTLTIPITFSQPFLFQYSVDIPSMTAKNPREAQWSNAEIVLTGLSVIDAQGNYLPGAQISVAGSSVPEPASIFSFSVAVVALLCFHRGTSLQMKA